MTITTHDYEMTCLLSNLGKEKEAKLNQRIKELISPDDLRMGKLDEKKLAWPIEKNNYLIFYLKTNSEKIRLVEKFIQSSQFIEQYLLINLDNKTKMKVKKYKAREIDENDIQEKNNNESK